VEWTIQAGIRAGLYMLLGFPGETRQDFLKTYNAISYLTDKYDNRMLDITISRFRLDPQSYIFNNQDEYGITVSYKTVKGHKYPFKWESDLYNQEEVNLYTTLLESKVRENNVLSNMKIFNNIKVKDIPLLHNKIRNLKTDRESFFSFSINEHELNDETGRKVLELLKSAQNLPFRFSVKKPLPRCIFANPGKVEEEFNLPKYCTQCDDRIALEDDYLIDCKGNRIIPFKDHNVPEIHKKVRLHYAKRQMPVKCKNCPEYKEYRCNGLCTPNFL